MAPRSTKPGPDSSPGNRRTGSSAYTHDQATRSAVPPSAAVGRTEPPDPSVAAGSVAAHGPTLRPPRQERSRATLERILQATEDLLERQSFESISIADIVRAAGSSVGSFYARFPAKEALLPALYDRYDAEFRPLVEQALSRIESPDLALAAQARLVIEMMVSMFRRRRWFMRAMALHARQRPETIGAETRAHRTAFHQRLVRTFLRHRDIIAHNDPESAIGTAIFMTAAAARDKVLFDEAPHASSYVTTDARLIEEMTRAFVAYLTTGPT